MRASYRSFIFHFRAAFLTVMKICYVLLSIVGHVMYRVAESSKSYLIENLLNEEPYPNNGLGLIKEAFFSLPLHCTDTAVRSVVACKVAQKFIEEVYPWFFPRQLVKKWNMFIVISCIFTGLFKQSQRRISFYDYRRSVEIQCTAFGDYSCDYEVSVGMRRRQYAAVDRFRQY